jgi:transcriptional regulator with XRE-family HTH domain
MKPKSYFEEFIADSSRRRLIHQEMFILEATECLARLLEREGVSKAELAERLGKSKAFVTQVLAGGRNMTMRTFADILTALGYQGKITAQPIYQKQISKVVHLSWQRRQMYSEIKLKGTPNKKGLKTSIAV